jgi:hypothetical protein
MNDQLNDTTTEFKPIELEVYRRGKDTSQLSCTMCGDSYDPQHGCWDVFGVEKDPEDYGGPAVVCASCLGGDIDECLEQHAKGLERQAERVRRLKGRIRVAFNGRAYMPNGAAVPIKIMANNGKGWLG